MKQKVSVLLIACLLLTGYHGLTISGKAEQTSKSESNEISVSGTEVRVQLLGEDLRRAAREAIEKGTKVEGSFLKGYSGDGELQKEYEAIFSPEKEVYEIPLDSISEGLSESLSEEEAGLQVFVERDAKDLESLVRKESKESLLLYDGNSQLAQLFPEGKKEEKQDRTEKAKEFAEGAVASSSDIEETAVASDSNIERRNTELTGSELITFLYKNKSEHKISFKLSVDGNQYPKLVVAPKAQLFKGLVEKLKKEEKKAPAEVKPAEKQEEKPAESKEEQAKEEPVKAESSEEKKQLAEENAPVEEKKELSEKEEKPISEVSIVSTEGKAEEAQPEAKEVEEKTEKSEERKEDKVETAEVESKEESAEKGVEAERDGAKSAEAEKEAANTEKQADEKGRFTGFLQEVLDHYEEFLAELSSARFRRYSLNELGRKTQNVEIKDFATVEVFYDEDAFTDEEGNTQEVVLKANRLLKKEEAEKEGEKLTDEQVEAMKEHSIYEGSDALDIRFVSKEDATKEVEPKNPVSVRLTFDKKAVPEEANADTIAIHHIVEDKDSGKVKYVETVLRSELEKEREKEELKASEGVKEDVLSAEGASEESKKEGIKKEEVFSNEDEKTEHKENITKEFMVESFSAYVVTWKEGEDENHHRIRFHYVDGDYKEIGPTLYRFDDWLSKDDPEETIYEKVGDNKFKWFSKDGSYDYLKIHNLYKGFPGYKLEGIFGQHKAVPGHPYAGAGFEVLKITNKKFTLAWSETDKETKVTTYHKKEYEFGIGCSYHEFYFRYKMCGIDQCKTKVQEVEPSLLHDKYITKNENGTYDLTLTGQTSRGKGNEKTKLDLVFVYDNTGNISAEDTDRTKKQMNALMDELSSEKSGFDARFALVTMNHEENPSLDKVELVPYSENVLNGEFNLNDEAITTYKRIAGTVGRIGDKELSQGYEIKDELYNDVTTMEFRRKKDIEEELKKVIHPGKKEAEQTMRQLLEM